MARASAEPAGKVLAVAERFGNAQIAALGHEVLGLAARDANELAAAETELAAAAEGFGSLGMPNEERRALRELLRTQLQHQPHRRDVMPRMLRLMELDEAMDRRDRALAGEDFDARLRYAEQEFELQRLAKESELSAEREKSLLAASNRQRALMTSIALSAVLVIAAFLLLQRRANRQLAAANARLRLTEQQLEREAHFDALTGLANRREFETRLSQALAQARAQATTVALLFLDLDHLKQTNDAHGHAAGDDLLRGFALRLRDCVPADALAARIGGDEFVVLLAQPDRATAAATAEAMAAQICVAMAEPLPIGDRSLALGTSIGIAVAEPDSDRDRLMSAADRALYAAKAAGRNTWRRET